MRPNFGYVAWFKLQTMVHRVQSDSSNLQIMDGIGLLSHWVHKILIQMGLHFSYLLWLGCMFFYHVLTHRFWNSLAIPFSLISLQSKDEWFMHTVYSNAVVYLLGLLSLRTNDWLEVVVASWSIGSVVVQVHYKIWQISQQYIDKTSI